MLYSDYDILRAMDKGEIEIKPFERENLQPASLDVRLDVAYRVPKHDVSLIDVADVPEGHTVLLDDDNVIPIQPGDFILATTVEHFTLGSRVAARVEGRSSLARLGIVIHATAGFIDPGFRGQVTLEISNIAPWEVHLRPGMRIGQMAFSRLVSPAAHLYDGNYQDQYGPAESKFRLDV